MKQNLWIDLDIEKKVEKSAENNTGDCHSERSNSASAIESKENENAGDNLGIFCFCQNCFIKVLVRLFIKLL